MSWSSVAEFFAMGGYGLYVWGAYSVTAIVIIAEVLSLAARGRAARRDAQRHGRARD